MTIHAIGTGTVGTGTLSETGNGSVSASVIAIEIAALLRMTTETGAGMGGLRLPPAAR